MWRGSILRIPPTASATLTTGATVPRTPPQMSSSLWWAWSPCWRSTLPNRHTLSQTVTETSERLIAPCRQEEASFYIKRIVRWRNQAPSHGSSPKISHFSGVFLLRKFRLHLERITKITSFSHQSLQLKCIFILHVHNHVSQSISNVALVSNCISLERYFLLALYG